MKREKLVDDIIDFVSHGKIPNAIELMRDYSLKHGHVFQEELVNMSSRYYRVDHEYLKNTIRRDDYEIEINRIIGSVMNLSGRIEDLIRKESPGSGKAESGIERTKLIGKYCEMVYLSNKPEIVRQIGGFSSFSIPDRDLGERIWKIRKGIVPRSKEYHRLQRNERVWLERIVKNSYCKLVVFPNLKLDRGNAATISRIKTLIEFIESNKEIVDVVTIEKHEVIEKENLLIVGNRFYCDSRQADSTSGYKNTVFDWDEELVKKQVELFDEKFDKLLKGMDTFDAREKALQDLKKAISNDK
jgi:hypothetical protein